MARDRCDKTLDEVVIKKEESRDAFNNYCLERNSCKRYIPYWFFRRGGKNIFASHRVYLLLSVTRRQVGIHAEITVYSYTEPTATLTKGALSGEHCARRTIGGSLKKPSRVAQSNSRGTDCRNFVVASTAANFC